MCESERTYDRVGRIVIQESNNLNVNMNIVTNENFKSIFPHLKSVLENASFISIDSEFTGITSRDDIRESLFDTVNERYNKLKTNIQPFIIIQFGITAFERVPDEHKYTSQSFTFYLLPRAIPTRNRRFLWQVQALEFLTSYGFDLNMMAFHGISYLDEMDEKMLREELKDNILLKNIDRSISYKDEDEIKDFSKQVSDWLHDKNNVCVTYTVKTSTPILQYLMHKELRQRFPNIWTLSAENAVVITKVDKSLRKALGEKEGTILEEALIDSHVGFSKVFKLLVKLKKPIVGHNILLDLMFMYQQFYRPLPKKLKQFKSSIHELFPIIYDTKFLYYELQDTMDKGNKSKNNSLTGIYKYFKEGPGQYVILNPPCIVSSKMTNTDADKAHDAGWDSFYTGYIFMKMSHILTVKKYGEGLERRIITNAEIRSALKDFMNCINVIRGSVSYLRLDGPDPESRRPPWLFVQSVPPKYINLTQITEQLSTFGTVDVKQFTKDRALIAVANYGSARDILAHFENNKELRIVPYNALRHSPYVKRVLWGSILLSGGVFAWMIHNRLHKPG